jgi:aldehyde:ferredoxin oxidoreductase
MDLEAMDKGYAGKILRVDLTKRKTRVEAFERELARNFIGGRGINVKFLYEGVKAGVDPLSPENKLIVGTGPLTATLAPCSGRWNYTTKSATTGILGDSNSGGHWAPELKFAGFDHIVIGGLSSKPVYIWIENDTIEIRDADHLWGRDTWEVTAGIQSELGDRSIQVMCIGPAGVNRVKYACPVNGLARAPARGGTGAVMGAKNLLGIAVRGTGMIKLAQPREFLETVRGYFDKIKEHGGARVRSIYGTPFLTQLANEPGWLSYKNIQECQNDEIAEKLSGESFLEGWVLKSKACFNCPIHCSHYYLVKEGPYAGTASEGLEFVSVLCFGLKTGVDYFPAILKANLMANRYGMDAGYLGDMIAWAMECFEKGILTEKDTDGLKLTFGNYEAMLLLIEKIARREGFGDFMAENMITASAKLGQESKEYAHHIKGLTIMPDIRIGYGYALGHATSNVGAHHLRGAVMGEEGMLARGFSDEMAEKLFGTKQAKDPFIPDGKGKTVQWYEQGTAIADCCGVCKFATTPYANMGLLEFCDFALLLNQATGIDFTEEDLKMVAERVLALERAFNAREGLGRNEDTLPPRMWEPVPEGPQKGFQFSRVAWEQALDHYYHVHGWNDNGVPTRETLESLGLAQVAKELEEMGKL